MVRDYAQMFRRYIGEYQPKIEERTGTPLGRVNVDDMSTLGDRLAKEFYEQSIKNSSGITKFTRSILFNVFRKHLIKRVKETGLKPVLDTIEAKPEYYLEDTIFYSQGFLDRLSDESIDFQLPRITLHSLTHCLWDRLGGDRFATNDNEIEIHNQIYEGFATYGEYIWFSDFLPTSTQSRLRDIVLYPEHEYVVGLRSIETLVEKHGKVILPNIPKNWKSLV